MIKSPTLERILKSIGITLAIVFLFSNFTMAQVSNDNGFFYDLYIGHLKALVNEDGSFGDNEWVVNFKHSADTDGMFTDLGTADACRGIFRINKDESAIGPDHNEDGIIDGRIVGNLGASIAENSLNQKAIDVDVRVFEDDTKDSERDACMDCACGSKERDEQDEILIVIEQSTVNNLTNSQNYASVTNFATSGAEGSVYCAWRYLNGAALGVPLEFGPLEYNSVKNHTNSNRIKPVLSHTSTSLGIHDDFLNYPNVGEDSDNRNAGEVHYSFSIDVRSLVTISTNNPITTSDTHLILKDASDNTVNQHDDIDGLNNRKSLIQDEELPAGTYTIIVDGFSSGGLFNLTVLREPVPAPSNDLCSGAIPLMPNSSACNSTTYSSLSATGSMLLTPCVNEASANDEVWFQFEATQADMRIDVTGLDGFQPGFEVYLGVCPSEDTPVFGCSGLPGNSAASYSGIFDVGVTYYVRVYDQKPGFTGDQLFRICVQNNNECIPAVDLPVGNGSCQMSIQGTNINTSNSGVQHSCGGYMGGDVWFRFTAPLGGNVIIETSNDGSGIFDSVIEVYENCGDNRIAIGCADGIGNTSGFFSKLRLENLISGKDYFVAVWEYGNNDMGTFNICAYSFNDECGSHAINLPVGNGACTSPIDGSNQLATDSGIDHDSNLCNGYAGGDVWFQFTAPPSGEIIIETSHNPIASFGLELAVYENCMPSASVGCSSTEQLTLDELTPNEVYYVALWDYDLDAIGEFQICAYEPSTFDPCNDGYTGPNALTVTQSTSADFITNKSIESSQTIGVNSAITVNYKCGSTDGQSITLQRDFEVKSGMAFTAAIGGCDTAPVSTAKEGSATRNYKLSHR